MDFQDQSQVIFMAKKWFHVENLFPVLRGKFYKFTENLKQMLYVCEEFISCHLEVAVN